MPGIYYGYRKKHEMTDIKTLVRKLLAGKLPQKEMPELWQRHDVTQYMNGIVAQNRPKTTSCAKAVSGNASSPARCRMKKSGGGEGYAPHGLAGATAPPLQSCWP